MNKSILLAVLPFLALGIVGAVYLVNSFVITADVYEPFTDFEYVIIGDAGEWDGITGCDAEGLTWQPVADVDVDGLYAGESRNMCLRFNNVAEADIGYTVTSEVLNTDEIIKAKCESAFPVVELTGDALKSSTTLVGYDFKVAEDAEPVNDCRIQIALSRG